jgi:succinate dehydrogenase / fumarate reductase flavoprotein subunit
VEHTTEEGEAQRNDAQYSYVSVWEHNGVGQKPTLHREPLEFEYVTPSQRSYK